MLRQAQYGFWVSSGLCHFYPSFFSVRFCLLKTTDSQTDDNMRFLLILSFLFTSTLAYAQSDDLPEIEAFTQTFEKSDGFFVTYYDENDGKIYLETDRFGPESEFLYVNALSAGIGSNDIGLDRGQLGDEHVVYFKKIGHKILLVQPNLDYRAMTENQAEQQSVKEAFAQSVLGGFDVVAQTNNRTLIDLTGFIIRDAHGVTETLRRQNQGTFKLDQSRSAINPERTKNFPKNTEFDAFLTFEGSGAGWNLRSVTPSSDAFTVQQHHSFVELPDDNYEPLEYDPRSGYYPITYQDYSTPIEESLVKRYVNRHRLEKKNPDAEVSEAVEPIIYYLDNGTPEPVRSALIDGAQWWNHAFEAAGYKNAFQVKVLPEGVDPLDIRYNVIQWVHRSTRGWSYGMSVTDPRTGEIIKGHVSLGSLRVRQDYMIAQGLLSPFSDKDMFDEENPMLEMALARIRQLSAHEIGHTIGLRHNFAASAQNRASVMDYPHPYVKITDGEIDLSDAYDTGIGEWDTYAVRFGYSDFPDSEEGYQQRVDILEEMIDEGYRYISDTDARAQGGAHPTAHLWDNGGNAAEELNRVLTVRSLALENFSKEAIRSGEPFTTLHDVLVPIYLFHRYQTEAAVKLIGGVDYAYAVKGDGQLVQEVLDADMQGEALSALLKTLNPEVLMLPEDLMNQIPPRAPGYYNDRELFESNTGPVFDPVEAARTSVDHTLSLLFHPARIERLYQQETLYGHAFTYDTMMKRLMKSTWKAEDKSGYESTLQRMTETRVLVHLMNLANNGNATHAVKSLAHNALSDIRAEIGMQLAKGKNRSQKNSVEKSHKEWSLRLIDQYMENPEHLPEAVESEIPPGSPIGGGLMHCGM